MAQEPSPSRNPSRFQIFIAVLLAAIFVLLAIGYINVATSPHPADRLADISSAAVCVVLIVLCGEWAIRTERRLDGDGAIGTLVWAIGFAIAGVLCVSAAVSAHADWQRSTLVQRHGFRAD